MSVCPHVQARPKISFAERNFFLRRWWVLRLFSVATLLYVTEPTKVSEKEYLTSNTYNLLYANSYRLCKFCVH